jgi:hypothetical protein
MGTMTSNQALPARSPRISDSTAAEVVRLDLRNVPKTQIAKRLGLHRQTVARVLARTRAAMTVANSHDLHLERERSLALYKEIMREVWEGVEAAKRSGKSPAALLAEARLTQSRIDTLLGVTSGSSPDDPHLQLASFRAVVLEVVRTRAPELAPVLAGRLLEVAESNSGEDEQFG